MKRYLISVSDAFNLPVFEFHRREAPEDGNRNLEFAAFRINFINAPGEIEERTVRNFDFFTHLVLDLRNFLSFCFGHLFQNAVDLSFLQGGRSFATGKTDDPVCTVYEVPDLLDDFPVLVI